MPIPIRFDSDLRFGAARAFLDAAGYTGDAICRAFGQQELFECMLGQRRAEVAEEPANPLDLCLRLFFEGRVMPEATLRAVAGSEAFSALEALGLIAPEPASGQWWSPVSLYPVRGVWVVSDRWTGADGLSQEAADDMVYAAMVRNTNSFLNLIPTTPCERLLDLCAGTGIAALVGARDYARTAFAYDLTRRCTVFAAFNARLNGLPNVTACQGDAYEPAGEAQFDRIVAHPPYVPVLEHKWIYHSGGHDGEQITRKVVEGLPRHLAPGGACYLLCAATDRQEGQLEDRLRAMLGPDQGEFDVSVLLRSIMEPAVFSLRQVLFGFSKQQDLRRWQENFRELGVTGVTYGPIVIQRRATARQVFTARRQMSPRSRAAEIHWMQRWETRVAEGDLSATVLEATLSANLEARLTIENTLDGDDWAARRYVLATEYPFAMDVEDNPLLALAVARLQHPMTGAGLFAALQRDGVLAADTPVEEFAEALAVLVSGGFVETSACPLPRSEESPRISDAEGPR
jgi:SAM-dependent methyltransferase